MDKGVILMVDDEENVRRALIRELRLEPYELLEAEDAKSALQVLKEREVDVIISDYRMPGVNGLALLRIVKDHYPEIIRIMLTGFGDMETVIRATNDAEIFRFFTKPWDKEKLLKALRKAMEERRLKKENVRLMSQLAEQLEKIRLFSPNYYRVPPASNSELKNLFPNSR